MLQLARSRDISEVNRLAQQVHNMHVAWKPDIYEMTKPLFSQERFDQAVGARQLFVALIDEHVAGYALVKFRNYDWPGVVRRRVMVLDELCVDEAVRRRGIGSQMIQELKVLGRAFGCTDLQLGVYPENDGAIAFYQKAGLQIRSIDMQMKL